jgi:hypothetical protein
LSCVNIKLKGYSAILRLPLWSEFLAIDPEVRVRFPALPEFLRSSEYETGTTQPRKYFEELLEKKVAALVKKTEITAIGVRHTDHVAPSICKSWH